MNGKIDCFDWKKIQTQFSREVPIKSELFTYK